MCLKYDVSKIVFEYRDINQIIPITTESIDYSELQLDFNKTYNRDSWSGYNPVKWFNSDIFKFLHVNIRNSVHQSDIYNILRTITSHIQKLIEKNEQNKQFKDLRRCQSRLEEQISTQVSQLSDMNVLILRMQSQMEEQSKIILEQQSQIDGMKKIMANMLREQQSTKSGVDTMTRQLEEQSKLIESLHLRDEKKRVEQDTLESEIDMILNGDI